MGLLSAAVAFAVIVGYIGIDRYVSHRGTAPSVAPSAQAQADRSIAGVAPAATFAPPPHSLAVLPFVNMSGDKEQEYFSDGLTEEILNSLARINELQVSARTSSFSFKGKDIKIGTIARELNVGAILEGSVRRSGRTIRITAQLNNAITGFHLWSQTYDRDLQDVLKLQTDIANSVASALKVTLLGDVAAKIEVGGTRNPAAFDAYLRAFKLYVDAWSEKELQPAVAGFTEATRLDPGYALAYAYKSMALSDIVGVASLSGVAARDYLNKARADAQRAINLAPDLADGHLALAQVLRPSLEFTPASQEYERALALAPGSARTLGNYGTFAVNMGKTDAGLAAVRRSLTLDPLNAENHFYLGMALTVARRYDEARAALMDAKALDPNNGFVSGWLGDTYYFSGDPQSARAACEGPGDELTNQICLATVYEKLGRHADADIMLGKARASRGDAVGADYAMVYAQRGDISQALNCLETAMRNRDPSLEWVRAGPWFDPLRQEPRFQAIERALNFPN